MKDIIRRKTEDGRTEKTEDGTGRTQTDGTGADGTWTEDGRETEDGRRETEDGSHIMRIWWFKVLALS